MFLITVCIIQFVQHLKALRHFPEHCVHSVQIVQVFTQSDEKLKPARENVYMQDCDEYL